MLVCCIFHYHGIFLNFNYFLDATIRLRISCKISSKFIFACDLHSVLTFLLNVALFDS